MYWDRALPIFVTTPPGGNTVGWLKLWMTPFNDPKMNPSHLIHLPLSLFLSPNGPLALTFWTFKQSRHIKVTPFQVGKSLNHHVNVFKGTLTWHVMIQGHKALCWLPVFFELNCSPNIFLESWKTKISQCWLKLPWLWHCKWPNI